MRPYTPIDLVNEKGKATFIIKVYKKNAEFPNGGLTTQFLENNLKVGEYLTVSGPIGYVRYYGNQQWAFIGDLMKNKKKKLGIIAGGTGLTPALSIMAAAVKSNDDVSINFLYTNKTKNDILCKDLVDSYAGPRVKITHTLTRHDDKRDGEWTGLRGRVDSKLWQQLGMPGPNDDTFIFYCGPPGMVETVRGILSELGYQEKENYF